MLSYTGCKLARAHKTPQTKVHQRPSFEVRVWRDHVPAVAVVPPYSDRCQYPTSIQRSSLWPILSKWATLRKPSFS